MIKIWKLFPLLLLSSCSGFDIEPTCDVNTLTADLTREQVMEKCGKPKYINGSTSSEQWVYSITTYIYIRNGHFSSAEWQIKP